MNTLSDQNRKALLDQLAEEAGINPTLVDKVWALLGEVELEWEVWGTKSAFVRKLDGILNEEIADIEGD